MTQAAARGLHLRFAIKFRTMASGISDGSLTDAVVVGTPSEDRLLPMMLLSGILQAEKTTPLRHILTYPDLGLRIEVIANDIGEPQNRCGSPRNSGGVLEEIARLAAQRQGS
jgi:hypothetical protein